MSWFEILLLGACAVLILLPPHWDPAIRIKEWQIKKGWTKE